MTVARTPPQSFRAWADGPATARRRFAVDGGGNFHVRGANDLYNPDRDGTPPTLVARAFDDPVTPCHQLWSEKYY
jgi:hypothetical protein